MYKNNNDMTPFFFKFWHGHNRSNPKQTLFKFWLKHRSILFPALKYITNTDLKTIFLLLFLNVFGA